MAYRLTQEEALAEIKAANNEGRVAILYGADLRMVNLFGANLCGANLRRANLFGADLRKADLSEADLRGARLFGADLFGADLRRANLYGADLRESVLCGAKLRGAYLSGANLRRSDLFMADLHEADLRGAKLLGANLHRAKGGLLQISDTPSGHLTLIPTPDGWQVVIGCWSGTIADLTTLLDAPDEEWPEARGETRIRREAYLRAVLPLLEAHITNHHDELQAVIEKWKDPS